MLMKNPPHPGLSVRLNCLEPFGLSVTEGAKALGVSRTTLSRLINGQAGVSADMAIRLAKAFGATPDVWIRMAGGLRSGASAAARKRDQGEALSAATGGVAA
jgi:antitoxin HigA-1